MKQYLTPEQTSKLIELGFAKPKSIGGYEPTFVVEYEGVEVSNVIIGENKQCPIFAYSIGELIEILPRVVEDEDSEYATISIYHDTISWVIDYQSPERCFYTISNIELVDALYEMIIKLKEEGI